MGDGDAAVEVMQLLSERGRNWLLIIGGRASASSGVPLPFARTRYAPSIHDLVNHHLFRTQSRQVFERVESGDDGTTPPLGYIADTLEDQDAWFQSQLDGMVPHTPLLRVADLAKAGMFTAVVSNAPDRLIDAAFALASVPHRKVTIDAPTSTEGSVMPLLREWDDRVYADTQDRRAREARFVHAQLAAMLPAADGVLVLGHRPTDSDLMASLGLALEKHPDKPVVWVNERIDADEATGLPDRLRAEHPDAFHYLETTDLGALLDAIASARGATKTPLSEKEIPENLIARTMNKSFDVRPVLVFVPGVALLGGLIDKLPRITFKMVLSLFALVLALVAYINYGIWTEYTEQIQPVEDHMAAAAAHMKSKDAYQGALLAEVELQEAARKSARVVTPYESIFSIWLVHKKIDEHYETINIDIKTMRDLRITPVLYRNRFRARVYADPSRLSLSNHPPVPVRRGVTDEGDPRGIRYGGKPLSSYRIAKPVSAYIEGKRVALYSPSAALLRVTMQQAMLRELDSGRLAFEIDLSRAPAGPLAEYVFSEVARIAGYTGERAKLYSPDGIIELLNQGQGSFYFTHLEASGVPQNLARISELVARFASCRAVISTYSAKGRRQIAEHASAFTLLSMTDFDWGKALGFLRDNTSVQFARAVLRNSDLRRSIANPLMLSLLVDHYRFSGSAPRSLGQVYDRLLQNMLATGPSGYAPKLRVLDALAWEVIASSDNLTRERATKIISARLFRNGSLDKAAALLDEMVANGVLRYRAAIYVTFMDDAFLRLSAAKYAHELPIAERARFLLANPAETTAYYAGLFPRVDGLVAALTADFEAVRAALQKAGKLDSHVNPYMGALRRAALAAKNGTPSPRTVTHLESRLFELLDHASGQVKNAVAYGLDSLSSAGVRRWVLHGLESADGNDLRLLMFTALSSEHIYVPAVVRWLQRVGTDADPKKAERFVKKHINASPAGPGRVELTNRLDPTTLTSVNNALTTLVQANTPESIQVVEQMVNRASDPRFDDQTWVSIRGHGLQLLLDHGHHRTVRGLLGDIAKNPQKWAHFIPELYVLNDAKTAETLAQILTSKARDNATVRRYKGGAALSLALMEARVARPAIDRVLASAPSDRGEDPLPYAALALAYRGNPADLGHLDKLVADVLSTRLAKLGRGGGDYLGRLRTAVGYFGDARALALYQKLHADQRWHERDRAIHNALFYLRTEEAATFTRDYLLCRAAPRDENGLISALGIMGTRFAHDELERIITMLDGRDAAAVKALCPADPKGAQERLARWKTDRLPSLIEALGYHSDDSDIPRFARWVASADPMVRKAARRALRRFADPAAGQAVFDAAIAATSGKREIGDAVYTLGVQANPANENHILTLIDRRAASPYTALQALAASGSVASLLRFYGKQDDRVLGPLARRMVFFVGSRELGKKLARDAVLDAVASTRSRAKAKR